MVSETPTKRYATASFTLAPRQLAWIEEYSRAYEVTKSEFLRYVLTRAMEDNAQDAKERTSGNGN
jgi:hypothetical protein